MQQRAVTRLSASLLILVFALGLPTSLFAAGPAAKGDESIDLGKMFEGEWSMKGRFRYSPQADWIPTSSSLVAESRLGGKVVVRDIVAPQINFTAHDSITYNARTGAAQYVYVSHQDTSLYIYEGSCSDGCRTLSFEQVCGPAWDYPSCDGKTSITFEADDRFVARDSRLGPDGEYFMTREVTYTRVGAAKE